MILLVLSQHVYLSVYISYILVISILCFSSHFVLVSILNQSLCSSNIMSIIIIVSTTTSLYYIFNLSHTISYSISVSYSIVYDFLFTYLFLIYNYCLLIFLLAFDSICSPSSNHVICFLFDITSHSCLFSFILFYNYFPSFHD